MPLSPLAKKLLIKGGMRCHVANAPDGYAAKLEPLPEGAALADSAKGAGFVQLFVKDSGELERLLPPLLAQIQADALLWVCYLKGGKKAGTDLNRDVLWAKVGEYGWTGVSLVAVDDAWSAMRFRKPEDVGR